MSDPGMATSGETREAVSWCIDVISANAIDRKPTVANREKTINTAPDWELSGEIAVNSCLSTVDSVDFNVFELKIATNGKELPSLLDRLFRNKGLFSLLRIPEDTFHRLTHRLQAGYNAVPFHNSTHAADVLQTLHYFLTTVETGEILACSPL